MWSWGSCGCRARIDRREFVVDDHGDRVGVGEEVLQLFLDVAVVHVDRDRAQLERREHCFQVLRGVVEVERDVVARANAARREHVREARGPFVELAEGQPALAAHEGEVIGNRVGDALDEIGDVELHWRGRYRSARRSGEREGAPGRAREPALLRCLWGTSLTQERGRLRRRARRGRRSPVRR